MPSFFDQNSYAALTERSLIDLVRGSLFFLVLLLLASLIWKICFNVFNHPLKTVPGPVLAKLFHHYMTPAQLQGRRAHTLLKLHETYGPVVRVGPNEVSISDFEAYRDIYNHKASTKEASFYGGATFLGHENIFSMRNKAQHSARRKMQNQPYAQQAVNENEGLVLAKTEKLLERIMYSSKTSGTGTADVYPLCGLFSLEVVCMAGFNKDIAGSSDAEAITLLTAMDDSALMLPIDAAMPFLKKSGLGTYIPGIIGHTFRQFKLWENLTRALFTGFQAESETDQTQRFMATPLLTKEDNFLGRKLTTDEAVEEAMGIAFAGSGTTSTTLVYLLYNLSRPENRQYQVKLQQELRNAGEILHEVKDLPYLNAVIKETMRLNPTIISTLPRVLDIPITVQKTGKILPAGTIVGMQNYVHQRDPSIYPAPHTFNPERWLDVDASSFMERAFTPFSLGPRNCIGQNLARAELLLACSKIFRALDLRLNSAMKEDDMEMEDRFNIASKRRRLLLDVKMLS